MNKNIINKTKKIATPLLVARNDKSHVSLQGNEKTKQSRIPDCFTKLTQSEVVLAMTNNSLKEGH